MAPIIKDDETDQLVRNLQRWFREHRIDNPPSEDDILGYGDDGIPMQPQ